MPSVHKMIPKYVQKRVPNRHPEVDEIHVFWDPIWDPIWEVLIVDIGIPGSGGALEQGLERSHKPSK